MKAHPGRGNTINMRDFGVVASLVAESSEEGIVLQSVGSNCTTRHHMTGNRTCAMILTGRKKIGSMPDKMKDAKSRKRERPKFKDEGNKGTYFQ